MPSTIPKQAKMGNNSLVFGILLLVVGIGSSYFWWIPNVHRTRQDLATAVATDTGLGQDIADLTQAQHDLAGAKAALSAAGINLADFSKVLPDTEEVPALYIQMEDLSHRMSSLQNSTYTIGVPIADPNGGAVVPITVTATGPYKDLKDYLYMLEHNIRPFSLTTVGLTLPPSTDKGGPPAGSYTMTASGNARALNLSSIYQSTTSSSK